MTRQALERAPGLDVCGVVVELDWQDAGGLATAVRTAHRLHAEVRAARPGPEGRFPRLPIVDQCTSSGLPARRLFRESGERGDRVPRSAPALAKLAAVDGEKGGYVRLAEAVYPGRDALEARRAIEWAVDRLGEGVDWVAVVHADGNGLGQIFTSFETYVGAPGNRAYADALRDFSDAVDRAALRAFREALGAVREVDGKVPILPLVLGGDDLTVVCDGEVGLPFAATYLRAFEAATAGLLPALPRLGAAAGVAVVKPHFPFSTAYDLAEELTDEAKVVKKEIREPASALSFHVLYDSAASSLADLRDRTTYQEGGGTVRLTAQPYVVTPVEVAWARHRRWEDLRSRVAALRATEDGERLLPRSQTHELRGGLHLGTSAADARFSLLRHRYGKRGVDWLGVDDGTGPSLFWTQGDGIRVTGLLDAMDAVDLLEDVTDADAGRARPATDGETR